MTQQAGEGNEGGDKEGVDDTLEAMPPKSASQASRSSKASRKRVSENNAQRISVSWDILMFHQVCVY